MKNKGIYSLRFQVFVFVAISGLVPLLLTIFILYFNFMNFFEVRIDKEVMQIAREVAEDADIKQAFSTAPIDIQMLQQASNDLKSRTGAYVIFMDMSGSALIDPYPFQVRTEVMGEDKERILNGETYSSRSKAYSAPSIRAFVPILYNGQQVGAVVAAFLEPDIQLILSQFYESLYVVLPLALFVILILSLALANNIKKRLFGMEPNEIGTRLIEREGILHSVKEGIIATDDQLKITVVNYSAAKLFPENTNLVGEDITRLISDSPFPNVILTKRPELNKQLIINENMVLSNIFPLFIKDRVVGTVITFSNLTEVNRIAEELTGVKRIVEALRARTHEFSNKLHVISGLLQLQSYEEAEKYVARVAIDEKTLMGSLLSNFRINTVTGLLMGKASEAQEKKVYFQIDSDSYLFSLPEYFDEHAIVIVLGNLIENAFDAARSHAKSPEVFLSVKQSETNIKIEVRDNGAGIPIALMDKIYEPGFTTKSNGTGYGLSNVKSRVKVAGGEISYQSDESGTVFYVTIPFDALIDEEQGGKLEWN